MLAQEVHWHQQHLCHWMLSEPRVPTLHNLQPVVLNVLRYSIQCITFEPYVLNVPAQLANAHGEEEVRWLGYHVQDVLVHVDRYQLFVVEVAEEQQGLEPEVGQQRCVLGVVALESPRLRGSACYP